MSSQPSDIWAAIWAFQQDPPSLVKSAENSHFGNKYVGLEQVVERVVGALNKLQVQVLQPMTAVGESPAIALVLRHVPSDTSLEWVCPLPMARVSPQDAGSAVTYFRRYMLLSTLGLVGDKDDDGERSMGAYRGAAAPKDQPTVAVEL